MFTHHITLFWKCQLLFHFSIETFGKPLLFDPGAVASGMVFILSQARVGQQVCDGRALFACAPVFRGTFGAAPALRRLSPRASTTEQFLPSLVCVCHGWEMGKQRLCLPHANQSRRQSLLAAARDKRTLKKRTPNFEKANAKSQPPCRSWRRCRSLPGFQTRPGLVRASRPGRCRCGRR